MLHEASRLLLITFEYSFICFLYKTATTSAMQFSVDLSRLGEWCKMFQSWQLHFTQWRQTQRLLRSNRAGVRWLSHRLWTCREESPGQSIVGGIAAKTSFDQLFVQYKCTVMEDINGPYFQLPLFSLQGFHLYEAHQNGRATTGEPTPLE